ncbi:MAG: hypothetical protein EXR69_15250 [Myxococcales bacterium]|nr:hypothetical protein [Myxococcales bacterium]
MRLAAVIFVLALGLRLALIAALPVMPYGDAWTRLAHAEEWIVPPWLPTYGWVVHLISLVAPGPLPARILTGLLGALAAAITTRLGLVPALGVALSPAIVLPGIAVYPESLALLAAVAALVHLDRPRFAASCLLVACLTRYDPWLLAPLLAWTVRRDRVAVALTFAGPAAWMMWNAGGPSVTTHLDVSVSPGRLVEQVRIWRGLVPWWIGWPAVVAALVGLARLRSGPKPLVILVIWAAIWTLFVAVARPYSPLDNARQLVVPALAVAALAGHGASRYPRATWIVALTVLTPAAWAYEAAAEWYDRPAPRSAAALAAAIPSNAGVVLVLEAGVERWPGATTGACQVVDALRPDLEVRCEDTAPAARAAYVLRISPDPHPVDAIVATWPLTEVTRAGDAVLFRVGR